MNKIPDWFDESYNFFAIQEKIDEDRALTTEITRRGAILLMQAGHRGGSMRGYGEGRGLLFVSNPVELSRGEAASTAMSQVKRQHRL